MGALLPRYQRLRRFATGGILPFGPTTLHDSIPPAAKVACLIQRPHRRGRAALRGL